ncbi:hypothetical protein QQ045_017826 [Rhodiola kirilowii]
MRWRRANTKGWTTLIMWPQSTIWMHTTPLGSTTSILCLMTVYGDLTLDRYVFQTSGTNVTKLVEICQGGYATKWTRGMSIANQAPKERLHRVDRHDPSVAPSAIKLDIIGVRAQIDLLNKLSLCCCLLHSFDKFLMLFSRFMY